MDVRLTPEQEDFSKVAGRLAAEVSGAWDQGRGPDSCQPCIPDDKTWARICDAGWLALRLPEDAGGADGTTVDVCVVAEQLGRHAVPAPVLGSVLLLEQLRLRGADPELLGQIAAGERRAAPVLTADVTGFATPGSAARAFDTAGTDRGLLPAEGRLWSVALAPGRIGADLTRMTSPTAGEPRADEGARLTADDDGIRDRELAFALTVVSADLLGLAQRALDDSVEHAKVRRQFDAPIGSFQAVQHLEAESLVSVEAMRSAVWYAAWATDSLPAAEALEAARIAKAYCSSSAITVVETAIQVFGGIGMTWESPAPVWQRRAHLDRRLFGDEHVQYRHLQPA